jgi:hypothetical protein
MTMPEERLRAIFQTREFLLELLSSERVSASVQTEARRLLRHYPLDHDLDLVVGALPQWFAWPEGRAR